MQTWRETKYQYTRNGLIASRDKKEVSVSSRIVCSLTGKFYAHHIPLHVKGDLIDLGCGKAPLFGCYYHHSNTQYFLDVEDRLEHANLNYKASLNEALTCVQRTFDSAILSDVLEHLERPHFALSSIRKILNNQRGVLILTVPFLYGIHEAPNDFRRFTRYGLKSELAQAGFKNIEIHELGGLIAVIATFVGKFLDNGFGSQSLPVRLWVGLITLFMKIPVVAHIDLKTAKRFPLEYGVICYTE